MTRPLPDEPGDSGLALGQRRVDPESGDVWFVAGINPRRVWLRRTTGGRRYYRHPPRVARVSEVKLWLLQNPGTDW